MPFLTTTLLLSEKLEETMWRHVGYEEDGDFCQRKLETHGGFLRERTTTTLGQRIDTMPARNEPYFPRFLFRHLDHFFTPAKVKAVRPFLVCHWTWIL